MASKYDADIVAIPNNATEAQIESAMKNKANAGWLLIQIVQVGTKMFAIFYKTLVE